MDEDEPCRRPKDTYNVPLYDLNAVHEERLSDSQSIPDSSDGEPGPSISPPSSDSESEGMEPEAADEVDDVVMEGVQVEGGSDPSEPGTSDDDPAEPEDEEGEEEKYQHELDAGEYCTFPPQSRCRCCPITESCI